jgi:alcohol dehydrogenase
VATLGEALDARGAERALVVTGRTVGRTPAVMDPIRAGLGDRLAGVFAETTPEKTLSTVLRGRGRVAELDADAIVAVGGGSSLDVAKAIAATADLDRSEEALFETFADSGSVPISEGPLRPMFAIPTTLAGADLTMVAGLTSRRDGMVRGGIHDERLMPDALWYDPELFRTTPDGVLRASAMNGFDKAIETVYAATATPITDGTAVRALRHLGDGLVSLGEGNRDDATMRDAIVGTILAQYGISRPDELTLSLIHAFGHGIARGYDVQQGDAHAIIAPHALAYLFETVDGRRDLLAEGLGVDADSEAKTAEGIVSAVEDVRDALGLSTRLREIPDLSESDLPSIATSVHGDSFMAYCPPGLDPTPADLEAVLRRAW